MVPTSDLTAARSESQMIKEELQAKVKDLAWIQGQLSKAQEQINDARVEAAQLRADMSCMVQRSELETSRAQIRALDEAIKSEVQHHREELSVLQSQLKALESEKRETVTNLQVCKNLLLNCRASEKY